MRVGIDFNSLFGEDNYALRHATGHNMLDPESVLVGFEINQGMDYLNSTREYKSEADYVYFCSGECSTEDLVKFAPRVLKDFPQEFCGIAFVRELWEKEAV